MVDMKIVFLGTSAAIPTHKRSLSSIVLKRADELLIFDVGEGMQKNFLQTKLGINKKMKVVWHQTPGEYIAIGQHKRSDFS